jgi:hypothetical protein
VKNEILVNVITTINSNMCLVSQNAVDLPTQQALPASEILERVNACVSPVIEGMSLRELVERACNFDEGKNGSIKDSRKAFELFQKAADFGHVPSMQAIALMYAEGRGIPKDLRQAHSWLIRARHISSQEEAVLRRLILDCRGQIDLNIRKDFRRTWLFMIITSLAIMCLFLKE